MRHTIKTISTVVVSLFAASIGQLPAHAADEESENFEDGPWITAIAWIDDATVVATSRQGLPFRPAQLVKAKIEEPAKLEVLAETEVSLWDVAPTAEGKFLISDFRGGLQLVSDGQASSFEVENPRWVRALAISPDETKALAGTDEGKLVVLSIPEMKVVRTVDARQSQIFDITFSRSGETVAVAAADGTVELFSWPSLEQSAELTGADGALWAAEFVSNDKRLVTTGAGRGVQLWDLETNSLMLTIASAKDWATDIVKLPGSNLVAVSGMDGQIMVVDLQTLHSVTHKKVAKSGIWAMSLSPDGQRLAIGTRKHGLNSVDVAEFKKLGRQVAKQFANQRPPSP